jgi:PPE-repeat protein
MAAAAAPYVAWLRTTAAQAEQTATQATAAAAAYDTAFAATVPPPVIAANRSLLMALVATNLFGQNTPAIGTTETQYAEMWAQDASAMYGYAGSSASATQISTFTTPPSTTNEGGQGAQAAAAAQSTGTAAGKVQSALASVPGTLSNLAAPAATPAAALSPLDLLDFLADLSGLFVDPELSAAGLGVDSVAGFTALPFDIGGFYTGIHTDKIVSGWAGVDPWPGEGARLPTPFPVITNEGCPVAAGVGQANAIGRLSVPAAWTIAAPEIRPLAVTLPAASVAAAPASTGGAGSLFSQMGLAGLAGGVAGTAGSGGSKAREPAAERIGAPTGKPGEPLPPEQPTDRDVKDPPKAAVGGPITSIAAELRELASLRDAGILTDEEFTQQKQRLLPGG